MRRQRRSRLAQEAHINVTSLLDITFVLLIAFMVIAPALRFNVDVELPQASDAEVVSKEKPVTIHVSWNEDDGMVTYHVNGEVVSFDAVADTLRNLEVPEHDRVVALEADRRVPWDNVARLITRLKASGFHNLGIVTQHGAEA